MIPYNIRAIILIITEENKSNKKMVIQAALKYYLF